MKPSISHLPVFGCGAYVYLPEEVRVNKLVPKLELMIFIGFADGVKGYLFMRNPNNIVFTAVKALFDKNMFPKCPEMKRRGSTPIGDEPDNFDDCNIPLEDDGHNNSDVDNDLFPPPAPEKQCATLLPPPSPGDAPDALEDSDSDDEDLFEKAKEESL